MKTLKEGKLPVIYPKTYRGICWNCQCQIEVNESELQIKDTSSFTHPCPTKDCNADIRMSEHIIRTIPKY